MLQNLAFLSIEIVILFAILIAVIFRHDKYARKKRNKKQVGYNDGGYTDTEVKLKSSAVCFYKEPDMLNIPCVGCYYCQRIEPIANIVACNFTKSQFVRNRIMSESYLTSDGTEIITITSFSGENNCCACAKY